MDRKELVDIITKALIEEGKIVEAGFVGLRELTIPKTAPEIQVSEMRKSFFAGAKYLFDTILSILDPESEPTEDDLRRVTLIHQELEKFEKELFKELN